MEKAAMNEEEEKELVKMVIRGTTFWQLGAACAFGRGGWEELKRFDKKVVEQASKIIGGKL